MRFDDYLQRHAISADHVDRFDGFEVKVEGPQDWQAVESRPGLRIWAWRDDPYLRQFCANAVLTMHRVPVSLDPAEVFSMLSDEQVQLVPRCHERHREVRDADDGIGIQGRLSTQFDSEFGAIDSVSHCRIIAGDQQTLIAQVTFTGLHDSPVDWGHVRLSVVPDTSWHSEGAPPIAEMGAGHGGPTSAATSGDR